METQLEQFIAEQVLLHREVVKRYCEFMGIPHLHAVDNAINYPKEVLTAMAYIDAYSKVANFINYEPLEVHSDMDSAWALATALRLFLQEVGKQPFDWNAQPVDEVGVTDRVSKYWDPQNAPKGFSYLVYFWYHFQRDKKLVKDL